MTVVDERWWFNCKVNGQGALLYDLASSGDPFVDNRAGENPDVVRALFTRGLDEAGGFDGIPDYLLELAERVDDAPGCSPFAAIPLRTP